MRVNFVLITSTAGKGYIAAKENKVNNLILLPLRWRLSDGLGWNMLRGTNRVGGC